VRVIPETYFVEGADTCAYSRRQHWLQKEPMQTGLPGTFAHIESSGTATEQERPRVNRRMVTAGVARRGRTGAMLCQGALGVGLSHSSGEACEGVLRRVGGAKGRAEQGTRRRER
jgi:hypothetical protein